MSGERRPRVAAFRLACKGCRAWIETTSVPEEADLRILEFVRAHREHFTIPVDENGISTIAYGVTSGKLGRGRHIDQSETKAWEEHDEREE